MLLALMMILATVPSTLTSSSYGCDGVSTQPGGAGNVNFSYGAQTDLVVTVLASGGGTTTLTLTTDYTLSVVSTQTTATLTLAAASRCGSGATLTISRSTPKTQLINLRTQGNYTPATHEAMFDRIVRQIQEIISGGAICAVTAKGDTCAGAGGSQMTRFAVGANNYIFTADSTQPNGIRWSSNIIASGGIGTAFGISATGGSTGGAGGSFTGGSPNADGIDSQAVGLGHGIVGFGSVGNATSAGVRGIGGSSGGGPGGTFSAGTGGNQSGITATGDGSGAGGVFTSGSTGYGATFAGNNTRAAIHISTQSDPGSSADGDIFCNTTICKIRIGGVAYSYAPIKAGTIALTSASPSTATVTLPLSGLMTCTCTEATTAANNGNLKCVVSGTTLTITGPNTVTDTINYTCLVNQ